MESVKPKKTGRPKKGEGRLIQKSIRLTSKQWALIDQKAKLLDRSLSSVIAGYVDYAHASLGRLPPSACLLGGGLIPVPEAKNAAP